MMMMMMMMMMLVPVLVVVVVVVLAGSRVAGLELLAELVRQLADHFCRMLLLLRIPLLQSMMKSVHTVRLGEIGMLLLMMIVVVLMVMMLLLLLLLLLLQRMMRRHAQQHGIIVIPRWRPIVHSRGRRHRSLVATLAVGSSAFSSVSQVGSLRLAPGTERVVSTMKEYVSKLTITNIVRYVISEDNHILSGKDVK